MVVQLCQFICCMTTSGNIHAPWKLPALLQILTPVSQIRKVVLIVPPCYLVSYRLQTRNRCFGRYKQTKVLPLQITVVVSECSGHGASWSFFPYRIYSVPWLEVSLTPSPPCLSLALPALPSWHGLSENGDGPTYLWHYFLLNYILNYIYICIII